MNMHGSRDLRSLAAYQVEQLRVDWTESTIECRSLSYLHPLAVWCKPTRQATHGIRLIYRVGCDGGHLLHFDIIRLERGAIHCQGRSTSKTAFGDTCIESIRCTGCLTLLVRVESRLVHTSANAGSATLIAKSIIYKLVNSWSSTTQLTWLQMLNSKAIG